MAISGCNWENDFTPWPAPAIDKRQGKFSGGAPDYLKTLTEVIVPAVEKTGGRAGPKRIIAGILWLDYLQYTLPVRPMFLTRGQRQLFVVRRFYGLGQEHYPGEWDGLATVPVYFVSGRQGVAV